MISHSNDFHSCHSVVIYAASGSCLHARTVNLIGNDYYTSVQAQTEYQHEGHSLFGVSFPIEILLNVGLSLIVGSELLGVAVNPATSFIFDSLTNSVTSDSFLENRDRFHRLEMNIVPFLSATRFGINVSV